MSSFTLVVSNSDYPLVPPEVIPYDPMDQSEMSLARARWIAAAMLDQYISNTRAKGRNVIRARSAVNTLEPQHYVELGALKIQLLQKDLIIH